MDAFEAVWQLFMLGVVHPYCNRSNGNEVIGNHYLLLDNVKIVPVLSNFLVESKLSKENHLKTLNLLSMTSYKIKDPPKQKCLWCFASASCCGS
ncbi:hypothetical protein E2C01_066466 [Portunus trituberculatus]|uniref:Uncharacterized protein n=1 Tax=Portunus trituberculatus TaxID=210409 RepID=A0A5B7HLK9_PORTR|nr:hypothetical protein [Portunus trituberculatus]